MSGRRYVVVLAMLGAGCGGGSSASPGPANAEARCPTTMEGPFARTILAPRPPPATGGFLADGTYELAAFGVDEVDPRPGHTVNDLRWHITFTTDQRDAQHQEGRVTMIVGIPPQVECHSGRFAVVGNTLRFAAPMRGISAVPFSVTQDGFVIDTPSGGRLDVKSLMFRRR